MGILEGFKHREAPAYTDLPELYRALWILVILSMLSGAAIALVVGFILLIKFFP